MCEAAMLSDPCKPLAQDVLKTLSLDLEHENVLMHLCGGDEVNSSFENDVSVVKSSTDDEKNLIELGLDHSKNSDPEHLSSLKQRKTIESLSSQGLLHQEEMCPITSKGIDACHKISSADEIQSSQMIGTLSQKVLFLACFDLLCVSNFLLTNDMHLMTILMTSDMSVDGVSATLALKGHAADALVKLPGNNARSIP